MRLATGRQGVGATSIVPLFSVPLHFPVFCGGGTAPVAGPVPEAANATKQKIFGVPDGQR
jgi:hypothetical protein